MFSRGKGVLRTPGLAGSEMHTWGVGTCWIQQWLKFQHLVQGHEDPGEMEVGFQRTLGHVSAA